MINVLAIDDDEGFRKTIASQFSRWSDKAHYSLDVLDAMPDPGGDFFDRPSPDVIILDLGLPGSGGASTVRRARRLWGQRVPIIVVTGELLNGETEEIRTAGAASIFYKPDISSAEGFRVFLAALKRAIVDAGNVRAEATLTTTMNRIDMAPLAEELGRKVKRAKQLAVGLVSLLGALGGGGAYAWQFLAADDARATPAQVEQLEAPAWFKAYDEQLRTAAAKAEAAAASAALAVKKADDVAGDLHKVSNSLTELNGYLRGLAAAGALPTPRSQPQHPKEPKQ